MKILVCNIGSTSFKFKLYEMNDEQVLARGGCERIGGEGSSWSVELAGGHKAQATEPLPDHAAAIEACLKVLTDRKDGCLASLEDLSAVGYKAVHGGDVGDPVRIDEAVLAEMERFSDVAPAHNPAYIAAMKAFSAKLPNTPQVAAFETGFHQTIPRSRLVYGIPYEWTSELGVRRYGFHGASHRYIAVRTAELLGRDDLKVISCHLGGSSSICAIDSGRSVANSFGMTPQSGLPHNNRVGEFDTYALLKLLDKTDHDVRTLLSMMAKQGGLLGISGVSNDLRDIERAAAEGSERATLAIETLAESVRHYIGAYLVALNGADVIVFTGGIGENGVAFRARVCSGLDWFGIELDPERNTARGGEVTLSTDTSRVRLMSIPTNEELIVARQTRAVLQGGA
ncbi:MAG: acetate/propionate family kinase [Phycisphaerae bacterium]|nr:acetate/propionate family kinase [Phycisphaerae bacterium]